MRQHEDETSMAHGQGSVKGALPAFLQDRYDDPLQSKLGLSFGLAEETENADRRERERACGLSFERLARQRRRARLDAQEPRNIGAEDLPEATP